MRIFFVVLFLFFTFGSFWFSFFCLFSNNFLLFTLFVIVFVFILVHFEFNSIQFSLCVLPSIDSIFNLVDASMWFRCSKFASANCDNHSFSIRSVCVRLSFNGMFECVPVFASRYLVTYFFTFVLCGPLESLFFFLDVVVTILDSKRLRNVEECMETTHKHSPDQIIDFYASLFVFVAVIWTYVE